MSLLRKCRVALKLLLKRTKYLFQNSVQDVMKIKEIIDKCLKTTEVLYRKACRGELRIVKEVAKRFQEYINILCEW